VDAACFACAGGGGTHQPIQIVYPTYTKEFKYDKRQRKVFEKEKLSADEAYFTWFEYDEAGNIVSRTDREERITYYQYDGLNRLAKMIDPMGGETTYAYDGRDNLVSLTDPEGQTTTFAYDLNNRLVKETRPMGQTLTYAYDAAGHLSEKVDPLNQKTEYEYDEAGRMAETRFYEADDHTTPVKTVTYGYDKVGNMISYDDGVTSALYEFDGANRKIAETVDYGA
jgi:YD repeat-containing protein